MAEECQAELKVLRGTLAAADKKKDSIVKSIKDQEKILQTYVEKAQSRTRDISRQAKIVAAKQKGVSDIENAIEQRKVVREIAVNNARTKVGAYITLKSSLQCQDSSVFRLTLFYSTLFDSNRLDSTRP